MALMALLAGQKKAFRDRRLWLIRRRLNLRRRGDHACVTQTSALGYGQIYVGTVNWLMMIVTIGLTLIFRKSNNLAAAYGIAVSATMLMTSVLLYMAMREHLRWSLPVSAAVAGCFLIVDSALFLSNAAKIAEGGYVPLALAALIYGVMWLWHSGREAVAKAITENTRRFRTSSRDLNKCECPAFREQQFF